MSTRPSAALVRFCLAGLVGVTAAARILCLCPLVEAAHAAQPERTASHSCCHPSPAEKGHSHQPGEHSHAEGCQHCGEQPQVKLGASGVPEEAAPLTGQALALALPGRTPGADFFRAGYQVRQVAPASGPPPPLRHIRTVVLLI
ncbi:MAG: hypothetical protein C0501_24205 [Isosphaera sp.]|nr:hypothetical protein [Isosphaera sp.]